jgi:hypothetical protein
LVDTLASGASPRKGVEVQVLSWAPKKVLSYNILATKNHCLCNKAVNQF